jgi:hypothetical protein
MLGVQCYLGVVAEQSPLTASSLSDPCRCVPMMTLTPKGMHDCCDFSHLFRFESLYFRVWERIGGILVVPSRLRVRVDEAGFFVSLCASTLILVTNMTVKLGDM